MACAWAERLSRRSSHGLWLGRETEQKVFSWPVAGQRDRAEGLLMACAWAERLSGRSSHGLCLGRETKRKVSLQCVPTWWAKPWAQRWPRALSRADRRCWGCRCVDRHRPGTPSRREEGAGVGPCWDAVLVLTKRLAFSARLRVRWRQGKRRHSVNFLPQVFREASVVF